MVNNGRSFQNTAFVIALLNAYHVLRNQELVYHIIRSAINTAQPYDLFPIINAWNLPADISGLVACSG